MNTIVIDSGLRSKLGNLRETVIFTDEFGHVLGQFEPAAKDPRKEPQITQEELERRERAGGGRSLAEILADLEKKT
jgi:hypothetical protein